ncbi:hypothetical protein ACFO5R_16140 [Halosolutus amylolyticus]|uniref:Small CPxCG-related zinc finger protein n=1 Tax=Halosolutus amylolyticus TaxID=2932267 RepID=A0ABD5PSG2_9EURY|nr:hypothetical protein [Halosolutus amylolyticus]
MTPQLTRRPADEPANRTATDPFPYGSDRTGFLLTATARGVLRSREPAGPIGAAGSTDCPNCSGETIDGAGLFACTDCEWTGTLR